MTRAEGRAQGCERICIVTSECIGPLPSGGIGTAMTGLAEALAEAGHDVTMLFTRGFNATARQLRPWQRRYREHGIRLEPLPRRLLGATAGPLRDAGLAVPSAVLEWLRSRRFDVVQFNDTDGDGLLALASHRFAGLLPEARFMVAVHSPREWVYELNRDPALLPVDVPMREAERLSVAAADLLWSPSAYLLQWLRDRGWTLPRHTAVQPYLMPRLGQRPAAARGQREQPLKTIVFFGRLEERKGLRLFLDAIDALADELAARDVGVVFLGKPVLISGEPSEAFIARRARHWRVRWRLVTDRDQAGALALLGDPGHLAVMASPADNSPCTVYECIEAGIPFLAARAGGIPELIDERDHERVLFDPDAESLARALRTTLESGMTAVRPAVERDAVRARWLSLNTSAHSRQADAGRTPIRRMLVVFEDAADAAQADRQRPVLDGAGGRRLQVAVLTEDPAGMQQDWMRIERHRAGEHVLALCAAHDGPQALVLVHRGARLEPDALSRLWQLLERADTDAAVPSAVTPAGPVDACGAPVGWSFLHGPAPTGCIALGPRAIACARECPGAEDAGPFGGLADRAIVGGARVWPLPEPLIRLAGDRIAPPATTAGRLVLYAHAPADARQDLALLAATGTMRNQVRALSRRLRFRLLASPLGFLVPHVMALQRRGPGALRRWLG